MYCTSTNETNILANIPAGFLTDEQKAGKREGLKQKGKYLADKAKRKGNTNTDTVNVTEERLDRLITTYGTKNADSDYSDACMAYIDPADPLTQSANFIVLSKSVPSQGTPDASENSLIHHLL